MKLRNWILVAAAVSAVGFQAAFADDDEGEGGWSKHRRTAGVAVATNPTYKSECGACHTAYPPGLLPARSWERIMSSLDKHFGEYAVLDPQTTAQIKTYLLQNAADQSSAYRSRRIMRSLGNEQTPLRITDVPYIRRKHDELSARYVSNNPKVRSLSNCAACHARAEQGSFSERDINIPGFGRWED